MRRCVTKLCAFPGCRESVGRGYVCRSHWRDLPVLLQRALTGARADEREAAERKVDAWLRTKQPIAPRTPAAPAHHEPKDHES